MRRVYESKIDRWLVVVLLASTLIGVIACAAAVSSGSAAERAFIVATLTLSMALPVWLMRSTRYALDDQDLLIRSGPFRWRVALRDVTAVTATRSPLSSPALSLDRLRIEYAGKSLMISPRDKDEFLRDLNARRSRLAASPL